MADDPVTISGAVSYNLGPGMRVTTGLIAGPADYDATNGAAFDVSSYVSSIKYLHVGACTAAADNLVVPRYVNDDMTDADGGAVFYTWDSDSAADAVLENVADTTDLSGYQFQFLLIGPGPTRT